MEKDCYTNLNKELKWLGIIDYKSLIFLLMYLIILWNISNIFVSSIIYRIYIEIIFAIPIIGLFYSNKSAESISDIVLTVLRFVFSPKLYVYKIESNNNLLN